jgi:signal transduction histidine kinase
MSAVGKMAAALAHEIRNPLNSMNLHIVLMERALAKFAAMDGSFKESINVMREEVTRLEILVREFLEYARPVELHFEPSDVGALIDEVISLGIPASGAKVHVERTVEPESMAVVLDRNRMKQALINLVRNAVEAMPGGGAVGVSAVRKDGELLVEVKDRGVGISEDARAHIFDLFFTTKESGTGLGLPIVMQLVELHGGTIEVESEETVGTTVRVRLPAV